VVVLDELAVVDEILAEIEHFLDAVPDLLRLLRVVDPPDLAVRESHGRPLDGVDGDDPVGFPRTLRLDLGARREEVVDEVHGRRVDPPVANPWLRARPYRSRNPPASLGWVKTGRPAIRSRRNFCEDFGRRGPAGPSVSESASSASSPSLSLPAVSSLSSSPSAPAFSGASSLAPPPSLPIVPSIRSCSHGQSTSSRSRVYRWIFGAFSAIPSAATRHIPPRAELVSTRSRSRNPETSSSPVASPSSMTGMCCAMNFDSLSFGEYWRPVSLSYNEISSA